MDPATLSSVERLLEAIAATGRDVDAMPGPYYAAYAYEIFRDQAEGCLKVVLQP